MQTEPLLSVIVPVYNAAQYLPRCVESLVEQTYDNMEVILVDDGSTDDSPQLCDTLARKHPKIRVLHKENAGAGFARNSGLDMARGKYVAFLDSDDYIRADMYAKLMAVAEKESPDAVYCDFFAVKGDGSIRAVESAVSEGWHTGVELLINMLGACPEDNKDSVFDVSVWRGVYSRQLIDSCSIRFFSERNMMSEDLLFNIDFLLKANNIVYMKEKLHYYCETDGSLTHRYMDGRLEREKILYQTVLGRVGPALDGNALLRWQRLFLGRVRSTIGQYVYYVHRYTFKERMKSIREVADDELVRSVINSYPVNKNPIKLRIFNTFLKWRFCAGMYLLLALNR